MPSDLPTYQDEEDDLTCEEAGWIPPIDSTCWQWNTITPTTTENQNLQKGCDYKKCQDKVCKCDPYCCDVSWDLSCRGYYQEKTSLVKNNFFVNGCSAALLCCESDTSFPKPPNPPNDPPVRIDVTKLDSVVDNEGEIEDETTQKEKNFSLANKCDIERWRPPSNSNCWNWNKVIGTTDGDVTKAVQIGIQKGCDHKKCQNQVCKCDPYCCDVSWDLSCRGYNLETSSILRDNYFVAGCSASILCCENNDDKDKVYIHDEDEEEMMPPKRPADEILNVVENEEVTTTEEKKEVINEIDEDENVKKEENDQTDKGVLWRKRCEVESWCPSSTSNCWQWNKVIEEQNNDDGRVTTSTIQLGNQKGCDHEKCQNEVCKCDSYCCDVSWDLSCRGHESEEISESTIVIGCSASVLCCEKENSFPKSTDTVKEEIIPPTRPVNKVINVNHKDITVNEQEKVVTIDNVDIVIKEETIKEEQLVDIEIKTLQKEQYEKIEKETLKEQQYLWIEKKCLLESWRPPSNSNCWNWNKIVQKENFNTIGIATTIIQVGYQKGCDYELCQNEVCKCDPYCCDVSWDLSCRGYYQSTTSALKDNYFVQGCSASILCCEKEDSSPTPTNNFDLYLSPTSIPTDFIKASRSTPPQSGTKGKAGKGKSANKETTKGKPIKEFRQNSC